MCQLRISAYYLVHYWVSAGPAWLLRWLSIPGCCSAQPPAIALAGASTRAQTCSRATVKLLPSTFRCPQAALRRFKVVKAAAGPASPPAAGGEGDAGAAADAALARQDVDATAPLSFSETVRQLSSSSPTALSEPNASEQSAAQQQQQQQQSRSDTPSWPWVQGGLFGSSTSNSGQSSSAAQLPLPAFWDLPRGSWGFAKQLAALGSLPSPPGTATPPPSPEPGPAGTTADAAASAAAAVAEQSASPTTQRNLARSLAAALRQVRPSSGSSATGGISLSALLNSSSRGGSNTATDDTALAAARLLQQVRNAVSDAAWEGFVDGVQLQAADALQLTTVESSITASILGDTSSSGELAAKTATKSVDGQYNPDRSDAATGGMSMSGRHMITHIPAMTSSTATSLQRQLQQPQEELSAAGATEAQQQHEGSMVQQQQHPGSVQATVQQQLLQQQQQHEVAEMLDHLNEQLHEQLQGGYYQHNPLASMRDDLPGHTAYNWDSIHSTAQQQQQNNHAVLAPVIQQTTQSSSSTSTGLEHHSTDTRHNVMHPLRGGIHNSTSGSNGLTGQPGKTATGAPLATYMDLNSSSTASAWDGSSVVPSSSTVPAFPKYEYLVFGGGGARCFGYAGALHALRQLGLLGRLKGVSGSSGGAVYALLAALRFRCGGVLMQQSGAQKDGRLGSCMDMGHTSTFTIPSSCRECWVTAEAMLCCHRATAALGPQLA